MLVHFAYAVDPAVLYELLTAWMAARAAGDDELLTRALRTAAARRQERANLVRVELDEVEARALAKEVALALEEHLAAALTSSRPLEGVQRLRRLAERAAWVRELNAPGFMLGDIGESMLEIAEAWRRADEALRNAEEGRAAGPLDLRWLPLEVVSVAMVSDEEQIGLASEIDALAIAQRFRDKYLSAGSFWDRHGTAGPGDAVSRYPHPIWNASPLALPIQLEAAGSAVRVSELTGLVSYVDARSIARYVADADPAVQAFARRVGAAVEAGHAVVSWVEAQNDATP